MPNPDPNPNEPEAESQDAMDDTHSISLRDHFDQRFADLEKRIADTREADQKAVDTALTAAKELADKHNDLIRAAEKKDESYVTRESLDQRLSAILDRLGKVENSRGRPEVSER